MAPAAKQMPQILAVLVSALAFMMLVDVFLFRRRHQGSDAASQSDGTLPRGLLRRRKHPARGVLPGRYRPVHRAARTGRYFIMTPLFLVATFALLRACRPWIAGTIAVVAPVFVYLVFVFFLDLPVPMGVMG